VIVGDLVEFANERLAGEFVEDQRARRRVDTVASVSREVRSGGFDVSVNIAADEEVGRSVRVAGGLPPVGVRTRPLLGTRQLGAE